MYRNIWYDLKNKSIWYTTWDSMGNRINEVVPYKPYLYIKDNDCLSDVYSIYNEKLRKMEFKDIISRNDYTKTNKRTYYNLPVTQQFLLDKYHGMEKNENFSNYPLSIYFIDIETYSPNGFPNPTIANDEITVITVYSTLDKTYHVFGVGVEYFTNDDSVKYYYYPTEVDMLKGFIRWWRKDFPDIVSGWYSNGFDIPYICNRINKIYDDDTACKRLSPVGKVRVQKNAKRRYGAEERIYDELWTIEGVTHIDMQAAYYKFAPKKLESYSLNSVCAHEGVGQKNEYEGSLADFWINNPQEFIDYNVQDVKLLVKLENKLKYMQLCRHNAYSALTSIGDSLGTIPIVTGLVALEALSRNQIISTFDNSDALVNFEGGYVSKPLKGFAKSIVSIDANSLYPSVIRTLNISNETKVGKFTIIDDNNISVTLTNGKSGVVDKKTFVKTLKEKNISISPNGIMFSQKNEGVLPALLRRLYSDRKNIKSDMLNIEKTVSQMESSNGSIDEINKLKKRAEFLHIRQWLLKIQLNSVYGASAEKHYALFDMDLSESVTSMGRETIKKTADILNEFFTNKMGSEVDFQLYGDTDSRYFTIEPLLKKMGENFLLDNGKINPKVNEIVEETVDYVNDAIINWHKTKFNCINPVVAFKREALSDSGLFLAPKMYALHILDDEGVPCDKVTYHGMAVVRSSTPNLLKPMISDMIDTIIKTASRDAVIEKSKKYWKKFCDMPMMDKVVSIGLNGLSKYENMVSRDKNGEAVPGKGTPRQVACAIIYNDMLERQHLDSKYAKLKEGDKLKIMYCKPNKYNLSSIAFNNKIPKEWENDFIMDNAVMFDKCVWSSIEKCFEVVGWKKYTPSSGESVDLYSFLKSI